MKVHQVCARLEYGDAITGHALEIDRSLRSMGTRTRLYAHTLDEYGSSLGEQDEGYREYLDNPEDVLIYHYSLYCPNYEMYLRTKNHKILIYHNITPPEFFEPYDRGVAEFLRRGRNLLGKLTGCELALGDSEYNRRELVELGFPEEKTGVLPIFVNTERLLSQKPVKSLARPYEKSFNVLFVGRRVPNKKIEDVIRAFFYYHRTINSDSHLFLVGPTWIDEYDYQLQWLIDDFGLSGNAHLTDRVSERDLAGYYRLADVYLSMSEHEGFAVPLLEAMAFDIPVLAYRSTAVPYTLGDTGVLFDRKEFPLVGELMEVLRTDPEVRGRVIEDQRGRLDHFSRERLHSLLQGYLEPFS